MGMASTTRTLLIFSLTSTTKRYYSHSFFKPARVLPGFSNSAFKFKPLCTTTASPPLTEPEQARHSILLERLRHRHLRSSSKTPQPDAQIRKTTNSVVLESEEDGSRKPGKGKAIVESFEELELSEEVMGAVREMGIETPTEIQSLGIPGVLEGKSVVLGSHTGSGKTLAYMLPLVQLLRRDEALYGMLMKPRRPRAVVMCPTRELSEQVFRVAKSISHHARFRSTMVSGGGRMRPQEDSLSNPVDMVVGTPGRILQHIEDGNIVYGDIRYLVLDEADTMFDRGFGPEIRKFLAPLKSRASKPGGQGFQTILVTATMTRAVQKLIDEEFQGITHLRTSTLHKKIASARHDFIKLSGSENKLEALLQVLEPSLARGNRVMVFCNTLNSSRAVDHYLVENQISTVNYHGEVPAEQRVENLKKFKSDDGDCPTLVCTDLAARGLDLDVDHVIMFDFPSNSIDYLHRTGRTARMGAKGKVTSLVAKKDLLLATRIEEAVRKNESLESLTTDGIRRDIARSRITEEKEKNTKLLKPSNQKTKVNAQTTKKSTINSKAGSGPAKAFKVKKVVKHSNAVSSKKSSSGVKKLQSGSRRSGTTGTAAMKAKLSVVSFRGRFSSNNKGSLRSN